MQHARDRRAQRQKPGLPPGLGWVTARPGLTLAALAGITLVALAGMVHPLTGERRIGIDPSISALRSERDEGLRFYGEVRAAFGGEDALIVGLEADDLFTAERLSRLQALTARLEALDGVERVLGLANAVDPRSVEGELVVDRFLTDVPREPAQLEALRTRALTHPLYGESLVAREGRAVALLVHLREFSDAELLTGGVDARVAAEVAREWGRGQGESAWLSGMPMIKLATSRVLENDLRRLIPAAVVFGALIFGLAFRSIQAPALATGVIVVGLVWTLGVMGWAGHNLNMITTIVPVLVVTLAYAYLMYFLCAHRDARRESEAGTRASQIVESALVRIWRPVVMTTVTTMAGFLSLLVSPLEQIQEFGVFATVGVLAASVLSVTLAPATLALGPALLRGGSAAREDRLAELGKRIGHFSVGHRRAILGLAATVAVVVVAGIPAIRVDLDFVRSLGVDVLARQNYEKANAWFGGAGSLYVVVDGKEPEAFREPDSLRALLDLQHWLGEQSEVGDTGSLANLVGVLYDALRDVDERGETLPGSRQEVSQLLLWVSWEDLAPFVDEEFQRANVLVRTRATSSRALDEFMDRLEQRLAALPAPLEARITGDGVLMGETVDAISRSQSQSLLAACVAIFVMLSVYLRSLRFGLMALAPNALPVAFYFGVLGWSGVTLNPATSLAACIVLGVAVDDTVHYVARFRAESARLGAAEPAAVESLRFVIRPASMTSIILCIGFLLFTTSDRVPLAEFGALAALTLAFAWLLDVTLTPVLCVLMYEFGSRPKTWELAPPGGAPPEHHRVEARSDGGLA